MSLLVEFNMKPVNIVDLVDQAVERLRCAGEMHDIHFLLGDRLPQLFVSADRDDVFQVITHLLTNAMHYSPFGQNIQVNVARMNPFIRVSIKDTGPVVSESLNERIFQKTSPEDISNTPAGRRIGLGFWIIKSIIEKYGGQIGYKSNPENGTTFYFDLPECFSGTEQKPGNLLYKVNCRALICEDECDVAALLDAMLKEIGFETRVTLTAAQAKQELARDHYDVMILDLALPDQDGISLAHELRSRNESKSLPIVIVSGNINAIRCRSEKEELKIDSWLEKPVNSQQLSEALRAFAF